MGYVISLQKNAETQSKASRGGGMSSYSFCFCSTPSVAWCR